jgi:hypothetical protein
MLFYLIKGCVLFIKVNIIKLCDLDIHVVHDPLFYNKYLKIRVKKN